MAKRELVVEMLLNDGKMRTLRGQLVLLLLLLLLFLSFFLFLLGGGGMGAYSRLVLSIRRWAVNKINMIITLCQVEVFKRESSTCFGSID